MARDRQRAKQRKQRQAPQPSSRTDEGNGHARTGDGVDPDGVAPEHVSPDADHIHRANVPGAWEHGGEVDRFEAELVAGAEGEPADDLDAAEREEVADADADAIAGADADLGVDERSPDGDFEDRADERADRAAGAAPPPAGGAITASGSDDPARGKGGFRFINFVRACWAELQRVQWPDRRQVGQATMVVLGFLVIAGAFLGLADYVAERVVDLII